MSQTPRYWTLPSWVGFAAECTVVPDTNWIYASRVTDHSGRAAYHLPIPMGSSMLGMRLYSQWIMTPHWGGYPWEVPLWATSNALWTQIQ